LRYNLTTAMSATYTPLTPSSPGYSTWIKCTPSTSNVQ
jgi:hypothetical protein